MSEFPLGRIESPDLSRIDNFPISYALTKTVDVVETQLILPSWHEKADQGTEGACVGFGSTMMMSIRNEQQCRDQGALEPICRYNPWWLWNEAKKIDPFEGTVPGDSNGTTVSAACDIMRTVGLCKFDPNDSDSYDPSKDWAGRLLRSAGIKSVRWAKTVDDIRNAIAAGMPLTAGTNWYSGFDNPEVRDSGERWIPKKLGYSRGGHCWAIAGASDARQAFWLVNSWGLRYPPVWISYDTTGQLLTENGEVAVVTDF